MGVFYSMSGSVKVHNVPEVEEIVNRFNEEGGSDLFVEVFPEETRATVELVISGGVYCSYSTVADIDSIVQELGPFAVEPTLIHYNCDGEPGELYIGRPEDEDYMNSRSALNVIKDVAIRLTEDHRT